MHFIIHGLKDTTDTEDTTDTIRMIFLNASLYYPGNSPPFQSIVYTNNYKGEHLRALNT